MHPQLLVLVLLEHETLRDVVAVTVPLRHRRCLLTQFLLKFLHTIPNVRVQVVVTDLLNAENQ